MIMRPDELANLEELERNERMGNRFRSAAQTAAGLTSIAGAGIASKILPFINEFIPADLAVKGISKVSPSIGNFLKNGQAAGLDINEGLNFVKEKMQSSSKKEERNLIQQYDPELHLYIKEKISSGTPLQKAGRKALDHPRFKKAIEKITKDHKATWSDILQSVYPEYFKKQEMQEKESVIPEQVQPAKNQQAAPGKGSEALMSILQKLQERRANR